MELDFPLPAECWMRYRFPAPVREVAESLLCAPPSADGLPRAGTIKWWDERDRMLLIGAEPARRATSALRSRSGRCPRASTMGGDERCVRRTH